MDKNQIIIPNEQPIMVSNNQIDKKISKYYKISIQKIPILYDTLIIKPIFICDGLCGKCIDKKCLLI
jgi:hypothetical protein